MKRVSYLSKGVSLRATRTDRTETTSTEISVSHRTPSLISRVTSHESWAPRTTVLKRPKKYLSALTWDTNDKGLQRTRDSKGQETPLNSRSKSRIDAPIHQDKKTSQMKPKTHGGYTTQAPKTFCRWKTSVQIGEITQRYHLSVNRSQYRQCY